MQQLLDLIAEMIAILLAEAKEKPELVDGIDNLSEKDDNTRRIEAQNLLESYGFGEKYTVLFDKEEHEFQGILDEFKKTPSFHCKRWILMLLSRKVSWETFADMQSGEPFYSMNSNLQETGIILLPKVPVTVTTHDGRPRKDPLRFSSWLNPLLEGCYFIAVDKLIVNGRTFRINNIIYQPVLNTVCRTSLQVAYSPLCNGRIEDFLQIEKRDVTKENGETHGVFTVDGILSTPVQFSAPKKAESFTVSRPFGSSHSVSASSYWNAPFPTTFNVSGSFTDSRSKHIKNAMSPISVTPSSTFALVTPLGQNTTLVAFLL